METNGVFGSAVDGEINAVTVTATAGAADGSKCACDLGTADAADGAKCVPYLIDVYGGSRGRNPRERRTTASSCCAGLVVTSRRA
jgi:hypothetical protein